MNALSILKVCGLIILLALASWILVHFFALFGIFLIIALPIIWLLFPKYGYCFLCRTKNPGQSCPLCGHTIDQRHGAHPVSLKAIGFNTCVLTLVTILSIGVVFGESKLLNLMITPTEKTVSFIIPSKAQYKLGEVFPMKIELTGIKKAINVIQSDFDFDPEKIEIVDISTKGSFANIFIQKEINNKIGYGRLTGGLPNPGFTGESGLFGTVLFRAKQAGLVNINFLPTSVVLANDGKGSNVIKQLSAVSYVILPEVVSPAEAAEPEVSMESSVLGAQTENQMIFFDETHVLGAQTANDVQKPQAEDSLFDKSIEFLKKADAAILRPYQMIKDSLF